MAFMNMTGTHDADVTVFSNKRWVLPFRVHGRGHYIIMDTSVSLSISGNEKDAEG